MARYRLSSRAAASADWRQPSTLECVKASPAARTRGRRLSVTWPGESRYGSVTWPGHRSPQVRSRITGHRSPQVRGQVPVRLRHLTGSRDTGHHRSGHGSRDTGHHRSEVKSRYGSVTWPVTGHLRSEVTGHRSQVTGLSSSGHGVYGTADMFFSVNKWIPVSSLQKTLQTFTFKVPMPCSTNSDTVFPSSPSHIHTPVNSATSGTSPPLASANQETARPRGASGLAVPLLGSARHAVARTVRWCGLPQL